MIATAVVLIAPQMAQGSTSSFGWGSNAFGDLGAGLEAKQLEFSDEPVAIGGLGEVTQIAAGEVHAVAADADGTAFAWGANGHGQLGDGATSASDVPVAVAGLSTVKAVAAGTVFSLALLEGGAVDSWGTNTEGQLGLGSNVGPQSCPTACSTSPLPIPGLSGVRAIAASGNHALALLENGTIESWGSNKFGQVGDGTTTEKDAPVPVAGITEAVAIAAGAQFSLAVLSDGEVRAWGHNGSGQLGDGTATDSHVPVAVGPLGAATAVAAGETHALALLASGQVAAWGSNGAGELGDGGKSGNLSEVPVLVSGLAGVSAIAAGPGHSFALLADGSGKSWGANVLGDLGDGTAFTRKTVPVALACGLTGLQGIAAGGSTGYAWGEAQETCPAVSAVSPAEGPPAGGTEVTLTGSRFAAVTKVLFGSTPAASFTVLSATEITATAPPGSETVDVTVATARASSAIARGDWFTYSAKPAVSGILIRKGPAKGGTVITIEGTNLGNVGAVAFDGVAAASFKVTSGHTVSATSPAGHGGVVDVTVTNPSGTSEVTAADHFTYTEAPEFGRCIGGGGNYANKGCTLEGEVKALAEWFPAFGGVQPLKKLGFSLSGGALKLESVGARKLGCAAAHGSGEFTSGKTTAISGLVLTGCSFTGLGGCHSTAAGEGEIRLGTLTGQLGYATKKTQTELGGLQLGPASGETLAEFTCGSHAVALTGSFVGLYGKENKTTTTMTDKATDKKGVEEQHGLKEHPEASLKLKLDAGAPEQAGVKVTLTQTNEEGVEINTIV